MTARRELLLVVVVCAVAYFTGLGDVPFYTRGEPREGLVVREMLRSGAWLVPQRPEGEIARKPPLYYWLAAPVAAALPDRRELALRIPSAVTATAAVVATWAAARTVAPGAALPAALVLATTFEWTRAATSARVDMTLAFATALAFAAWLAVVGGSRRRWLAVAAAGTALATLAKGPVGLVLPALAGIAYAAVRRDRAVVGRLGLVPVLGVAAAVAAAWYLVAFAEQGRGFVDVVLKENLARFIDADEAKTGHAHGISYLALVGLVGFLPWVPFLPLVSRARGGLARTVFAVTWAAVVVVFFSIANAKRSVYLLPAFPALAVAIGSGIASGPGPVVGALARAYRPALVVLAALALALAAGVDPGVALHRWLRPDDAHAASALAAAAARHAVAVAALGVATLGAGFVVERARRAGRWTELVVCVAAASVAWTAVFDAVLHPALARTRSLRDFMAAVDRLAPPDAPLAVTMPADPGLRFYAPRPLVRLDPAAEDRPGYLLVWEDEWRRLRDATGAPLAVVAVSESRQARRGALALAVAPPGRLRRVPPPTDAPRPPGLRTDSRSR